MPGPWKWRRWEIQSLWKWWVSAPGFMEIPVLLSEPVAAPGCQYRPAASEQTSWLWLHIKSHLSKRSWPVRLPNSERRVLNLVVSFGRSLSGFCPLPTVLQPWAGGTWNCRLKNLEGIDKQTDHLASKTILNTPTTYLSLPLRADLNPSGIYLVPDFTGTVVQSTRSELLLLSPPQRSRLAPIFPKGLNLTLTGCWACPLLRWSYSNKTWQCSLKTRGLSLHFSHVFQTLKNPVSHWDPVL